MKCKICGADIPDGAKFCPSCGYANEEKSEASKEVTYEQTIIPSNEVFPGFGGPQGNEHFSGYCTHCGAPLDAGSEFCPKCGTRVQGFAGYCNNCGAPLEAGLEYCRRCGARTSGNDYTQKNVGFVEAFRLFFKKYFKFSGRATRQEFWYVFLWQLIIGTVIGIVETVTKADMLLSALLQVEGAPEVTPVMIVVEVIAYLWDLATFIPSLSLAVRRLHDTGKSGFWIFINLVPLVGTIIYIVYLASPSQQGPNQYDERL